MENKTFDAVSTSALSITDAFSAAVRATLSLDLANNYPADYRGNLQGLYVSVSTISTAASLTMRLTTDTAGDAIVIGDSTATLSTGLTTGTSGNVTFKIALDAVISGKTLYAFFKTDAGTLTVTNVQLVYRRRL